MNGDNPPKPTIQYSKEDVEIMQRIYKDGALQRGIPGALVGGGLGWMFLKRLPSIGKIPKAIGMFLFASLGNTLGFATYVPTARRRMMDQLPEESTLRKMLTGDIGPDDWNSPEQQQIPSYDDQRDVFDDFPDANMADSDEKVPTENPTLRSYQDLRNKNRGLDAGFDSGVSPDQQLNLPAKKYNKYGDEIVD